MKSSPDVRADDVPFDTRAGADRRVERRVVELAAVRLDRRAVQRCAVGNVIQGAHGVPAGDGVGGPIRGSLSAIARPADRREGFACTARPAPPLLHHVGQLVSDDVGIRVRLGEGDG